MMGSSYCLDKDELNLFLENILYKEDLENGHLEAIVEYSKSWEVQASGLSYFLGRIIQRKINTGLLDPEYINKAYDLTSSIYFSLNEFEYDFLTYVMRHDRLIESTYTLDEILNLMHANFSDKNYERIVRY